MDYEFNVLLYICSFFLFLHYSVTFPRKLFFMLVIQLVGAQLLIVFSYSSFYFWKISRTVHTVISDVSLPSFFLSEFSKRFVNFVALFKEKSFYFTDFSSIFLLFIFLCSINISFLLLTFDVVCSSFCFVP